MRRGIMDAYLGGSAGVGAQTDIGNSGAPSDVPIGSCFLASAFVTDTNVDGFVDINVDDVQHDNDTGRLLVFF